MASLASSPSLLFSPLQLQIPTPTRTYSLHQNKRPTLRASVSDKPSYLTTDTKITPPKTTNLPVKKIPGDCGLPFVGPLKDRLDYFYNQGRDEFLKSKIHKHKSTVFRTNMPPGPFISQNPRVVALLDAKSFSVLFDVSKVEKRDLFTGTFMPSTQLTGGYRVLSYLDPSEPNHANLKQLIMFLVKSARDRVVPEFNAVYDHMFQSLETSLASTGKAQFNEANDQAAFNFLARSLHGTNPADTELGADGPKIVQKWVLMQLSPILTLGLPKYLEELTIHTVRLPPILVKKDYQKLYDFFYSASGNVFDEADKLGISRDEACHNLIFATCFNSFGGMRILFPNTLKWIGRAGAKLHAKLAEEIRSAVRSNNGKVSMRAMENMPLMKSVVYESLRIEPPVPLQYGRAKRDLMIESHEVVYQVKEGELMFGYQPFATKDPRIFERAEEFVADRFVGEQGEKLLKHVLWSNGPETENPTLNNKQCVGKDFIVLVARLFVVQLFLRYDTFAIEVGKSPIGCSVTLTSLKRASN